MNTALYKYIILYFFFFNDTATTEIYTLSLHDALPISDVRTIMSEAGPALLGIGMGTGDGRAIEAAEQAVASPLLETSVDRKSTRLNSSHANISYAVFCLKKKNKMTNRLN